MAPDPTRPTGYRRPVPEDVVDIVEPCRLDIVGEAEAGRRDAVITLRLPAAHRTPVHLAGLQLSGIRRQEVGLRDVTVLAATHEDVVGTVTVIVDRAHVRLRDELVAFRIGGLALPQELDIVVHADEVVDIRRVLVVQRNLTGGLLRRIPGGDLPVLLREGLTLVLGLLRDDIRRLAVLQM